MHNLTGQSLQLEAKATTRGLIAVVDDDVSFLQSVGRLLRTAGYEVKLFGSGGQFLASLPAFRPQCLVLDVHMPEMTGLELQDQLTAQGSSLPLIFVTAYETPVTREHALRAGSFGLLLKPFDQQALLQAVQKALSCRTGDSATGGDQVQSPLKP